MLAAVSLEARGSLRPAHGVAGIVTLMPTGMRQCRDRLKKKGGCVGNNLDAAQIAKYRKDGYVFPVPALTSGEAADVRTGIEDFERRRAPWAGHVIRNRGPLKLTRLYDLVFHSRVLDAVESILGPDILCWGSSLFVTEGNDPGFIAWHPDSSSCG